MGYEKNEVILALIKEKGPILPVDASKKIGDDIIIASAYLATLVSRAEVKVSHLKVGGSPLYFLPGQEAMLQNFADRLNPPDRRVYNLLKERKVLRDSELEPVQRVSLRAINDFALPLNVKHEGKIEVFWKWYLLADAEAEPLIKRLLHVEEPVAERPVQAVAQKAPEPRPEPQKKPIIEEPGALAESPKPVPIAKKAEEKPFRKRPARLKQEVLPTEPVERPAETAEPPRPALGEQKFGEPETKDKFFEEVKEYFASNSIMVLESAIVKKNSELDLVVSVPSAVGRLTYYCKAKNKKKSNDGDLASAYVQGQSRKLPTLYLSRGELMKKASEMLAREFRGIVVKTF
jgi:hypothetical protein